MMKRIKTHYQNLEHYLDGFEKDKYIAWYDRRRFTGLAYSDDFACHYQDGHLHNIHGPAVEYTDGRNEWWIFGEKLTMNEWAKRIGIYDTDDYVMMKLEMY